MCMRTRPVYHRSFKPFEYFIDEGSKAKLNIRPSPSMDTGFALTWAHCKTYI